MIIVRACARPGGDSDGWDMARATLAGVDREGGADSGHPRVLVTDGEPPGEWPWGWRVVRSKAHGSRESMWTALNAARTYPGPVLILEDDLKIAPGGVAYMLGSELAGCPMVSHFYPRFAGRHEPTKPRIVGYETWGLNFFTWSQALLFHPAAIARIIDRGYFPHPDGADPLAGCDWAVKTSLLALGYTDHRVRWPSLVQHMGGVARSAIGPTSARGLQSDWFAGPGGY